MECTRRGMRCSVGLAPDCFFPDESRAQSIGEDIKQYNAITITPWLHIPPMTQIDEL